jgi:thiol-disulfide isomerase/thioredoxin
MFYQAENNKIPGEKKLKILNFYSDTCPPCHAFMPNFIEAEKTY